MAQDLLSSALNNMMNAQKARKQNCEIRYINKMLLSVLDILKEKGYVSSYKVKEGATPSVVVEFGALHEVKAIKPRFYVAIGDIEKYVRRYLPAKDFGIIILSTNKGLLTHQEAIENNIGGSLIAYCF